MGIEKAQLRKDIVEGLAQEIEQSLEPLLAQIHQIKGGIDFGRAVHGQIQSLQKRTKELLDDGKLELEEATLINKNYQTVHNLVTHMLQGSDGEKLRSEGRYQQQKKILMAMQKVATEQAAIVKDAKDLEENPEKVLEEDLREDGYGLPPAAEAQIEAAKEKLAAKKKAPRKKRVTKKTPLKKKRARNA